MSENITMTEAAREAALATARTWNDAPVYPGADRSHITSEAALAIAQAVVNADQHWHDAARSLIWDAEDLLDAKTVFKFASEAVNLANSLASFMSWLPDYDYETGTIPRDC